MSTRSTHSLKSFREKTAYAEDDPEVYYSAEPEEYLDPVDGGAKQPAIDFCSKFQSESFGSSILNLQPLQACLDRNSVAESRMRRSLL